MSSGNVILVTGANGSLGSAMSESFLGDPETSFVWLGVHSNENRVQELVNIHPNRCGIVHMDVTNELSWSAAVEKIKSTTGKLDVLINNAGGHEDALLAQMPVEQWSRIINLNLNSVFFGCQAVLGEMIGNRYGRIVNISSLSALLAPMGQTNYAAAKAGVVALTQSLAKEVARIGITVNAVCPGHIGESETKSAPAEEEKQLSQKIPMRRFGKPNEVAAAVKFLASREASYITGSVLKVDGGIL